MKLQKLRRRMQKEKIGALLITNRPNVRYLSGTTAGAWALVALDSQFLLTDSRYIEQAGQETAGWDIVLTEKSPFKTAAKILKDTRPRAVGFESSISFDQFQELRKQLKGKKLLPIRGWVEKLRIIKTGDEQELLRTSASIVDETFTYALGIIKPGKREREIAAEIEYFIGGKKEADTSFEIILVSGARSSLVHGKPSSKILKKGDMILLDMGINWRGYCSDLTRTICLGRMNSEQKRVYQIVRKTQEGALRGIKPGIRASAVYSLARKTIENAGYSLGHALGHGLGLEIHEPPRMGNASKDIIRKDMVITVEPGIYIEGKFGVRIEDMVLVEKNGAELLTHSPRHPIEL